jgi:transposase
MKELWRGQLDLELTQLDALSQQIADAEKRLGVIAADHEGIQRLQTIPESGREPKTQDCCDHSNKPDAELSRRRFLRMWPAKRMKTHGLMRRRGL